jgi:hypothetical protein
MYFTHMSIEPVSVSRRIAKGEWLHSPGKFRLSASMRQNRRCKEFSIVAVPTRCKAAGETLAAHTEQSDVSWPYCQQNGKLEHGMVALFSSQAGRIQNSTQFARTYGEHCRHHANVVAS